jgi:hypothetical protein
METIIGNLLETIRIDEPYTYKNMSVAPLSIPLATGPDYLTMRQGFDTGVLTVQEISERGSVPELAVFNRGDVHTLLLDGEEIRGAKQNRVLNTSILVAPVAKCVIPVSCTEQGRWNYTSKQFEDSGILMARSIRSHKQASVTRNVRESRNYHSDQGEVWDQVQGLHRDLGTASATGAMRDAYELKKTALDDYAKAFASIKDINGIAVFIDGTLVGVDFLSHQPAMNDLLPKLISSYAMDALRGKDPSRSTPQTTETVSQFLHNIGRCAVESHPSQGVGEDARLEGSHLQGAALVAFGQVIHMAAFTKIAQQASQGGMASLSRRRYFRLPM